MQKRLTLMISILIICTVIVSTAFSINGIRATNSEEARIRLTVTARLVSGELEKIQVPGFDYDAYAGEAAKASGSRVTIIGPAGRVLGDSDSNATDMENHFYREEVQKAYTGVAGYSRRVSTTLKQDMLYVAFPFKNLDGTLSVVRVARPIGSVEEIFRREAAKILIITVMGIIVALLLSNRFVARILKPVRELSVASTRIAEGQYGHRIIEVAEDEIGDLTRNFNLMSEKLRENIEENRAGAVKNQAILSSMINGIIAVDNDRKVMFINPVAEKLLGIREDQVKQHHIMEIIRSKKLDDCLENFLLSDRIETTDIEINEPAHCIISISTTPMLHDDSKKLGVVILLQDVTEIRRLEQMRKDFVANVSHELKTPLTSIQGFVETLKNGAAESKAVRDKFLDIIEIESTRLSALIDDLLSLSAIENRFQHAAQENIPVRKAMGEVVEMLSEQAVRKGITLTLDIPSALPPIVGNTGWFKQMVINIVDNAIKYTPENGSVNIEVSTQGDVLEIEVSDSGIGISPEHIDRLFERFYRVDKARSREVGGTGLGLAIVKHIAIAMGGQITVTSQLGQGSVFKLKIPGNRQELMMQNGGKRADN